MPIRKIEKGCIIEHSKFGKGIILGNEQFRKVYTTEMMFYHIYYYKTKTFGYAAVFSTIKPATDATKAEVQQILMDTLKSNKNTFQNGDLISHPRFGKGIILGNGHKRSGKIYYHIYYFTSKTFGYNKNLKLECKADNTTKKQAKKLLLGILITAF